MKRLNGYRMMLELIGFVAVIMVSAANAWGAGFLDDFDRPDGEVGNGWSIWTDGGIEPKIVDNEVLIAGQQGRNWRRSGIYRPVDGETRFSFDFKADDQFNVHIELYDQENPDDGIDFYAWPGGPFYYSYRYRVSNEWTGWIQIPGSQMRAGEYNNLVVEQDGTEFTLTLNDQVIGTATKDNIIRIGEVFIGSDAAAGIVGSLHIDNVIIGQTPITDFNADGIVDSKDMWIMYNHMGEDYPLCDIAPQPFGDGIVNSQDLLVLAGYLFPDLVARWRLDEEAGDIALDCIGGNNGTCHGGPVWAPSVGNVGGALVFDGADDYVSAPSILDPVNGAFSAFAWIYGGAPGKVILSQADGTGSGSTWLGINSLDGTFMTGLFGTLESGTVITNLQWHHVGVVYDVDSLHRRLYVDGILSAEDTTVVAGLPSDGGLHIGAGRDLDPASFFLGMIDDVRIYNVALSDEKVEALAK